MPGRQFNSDGYRFGFNGQEKDDEVSGTGNINTAMFWEYDSRLGRRWNVDPVVDFRNSSFTCFDNNPVLLIDKNGKLWELRGGSVVWISSDKIYGVPGTEPITPIVNRNNLYAIYAEKLTNENMQVVSIRIYNSDGTTSVKILNDFGLVEIPDGENNISNYSPNDVETESGDMYMNADAAVAFYRTVGEFMIQYPEAQIEVGDASTSEGNSPRIAYGTDQRHVTHYRGNAIDVRYLDISGRSIQMATESASYDHAANDKFLQVAQKNGLNQIYVGSNSEFEDLPGTQISGHNDHFHIGIEPISTSQGKRLPSPRGSPKCMGGQVFQKD